MHIYIYIYNIQHNARCTNTKFPSVKHFEITIRQRSRIVECMYDTAPKPAPCNRDGRGVTFVTSRNTHARNTRLQQWEHKLTNARPTGLHIPCEKMESKFKCFFFISIDRNVTNTSINLKITWQIIIIQSLIRQRWYRHHYTEHSYKIPLNDIN